MKNYDVACAWMRGQCATGHHLYTDGVTLWSYGPHFPVGWHHGARIYYNKDRYSVSTSQHQSFARQAMEPNPWIPVTTKQICKVVATKGLYRPNCAWWRTVLYKKLVHALAAHGVVLVGRQQLKYGDLVAAAEWEYERGNLCLRATHHDVTWLHGRSSSPQVNAKEPVYVGIDVAALLKA